MVSLRRLFIHSGRAARNRLFAFARRVEKVPLPAVRWNAVLTIYFFLNFVTFLLRVMNVRAMFLERLSEFCVHRLCWGQIGLYWFPSNLPKIKALKNSEESGKNQKTFYCSLPNIKYELHESLWNLKLKAYLKLKTCLLNHPRGIECFFICSSFTVRKKSVKGWFVGS